MDKIDITIKDADKSFEIKQFADAHEKYSAAYIQLINYFDSARTVRSFAKGAGWVAGFLTGGFGVEDLIIIPLVNNAVLRFCKLDIKELAKTMNYTVKQKISCVLLDVNLLKQVDEVAAYNDILLSYKLTERTFFPKDKVQAVFDLVNPLADENSRIFKVESKPSLAAIIDELIKYTNMTELEFRHTNGLLFTYLEKSGNTESILYRNFLQKGYHSSGYANTEVV
jgi:hypothetical protein